ncbi:MAG: nuclear transport factor 2 family protein [Bacteroidetes bacterium]|nr:nuclear transport factor 2 family protein [Bacteroidota bacterium]MBU1372647.1 nuclear transport factor 2 family protein [Bacteroidota bacterium]MBU1484843.1 nuclear transport factor 2 family protein [Bacteroidota bacterium]MBU1761979.1 nuclear transport factor 2 family protein [Bacteroidota bacterium]MBU2266558.1 nuclear transport factor 2 family protein [Bacteroidota bacterium]
MKKLVFTSLFLISLSICSFAQSKDEIAIKTVLKNYQNAIEKLSVVGVADLFVSDSQIVESGSLEGNISTYLEHHLGPELKEFKSFKFSDYEVKLEVEDKFAFSTESYIYTIVLPSEKEVKQKGVATSVLVKTLEGWKIKSTHTSASRVK